MITVDATPQSGQRVLVSISGLTGESVDRILDVQRIAPGADPVFTGSVRGSQQIEVTSGAVVLVDQEAPFDTPVTYTATWVLEDDTIGTAQSGFVLVSGVRYPRLSDPLTGSYVDFTVETWPQIDFESGVAVVEVHGRRGSLADSIVIAGPISAPKSQLVVRFDDHNAGGPTALLELLTRSSVLLLRSPDPTVEGYLAVQSATVARLTQDPRDRRRRVTMSVTHVSAPDLLVSAEQATLEQLYNFEPGTLADLAGMFPTLRDIAVADLGA